MKILRYVSGILLLLMYVLPVSAAADEGERAFGKAKSTYQQLQNSTKNKLYRENWLRVIQGFEGVSQAYPNHDRAADALYLGGKACEGLYAISRRKDDARQAVDFYDRLPDRYPGSSLADDAGYLAGLILERILDDRPGAYLRYKLIVDKFPQGDMLPLCREGEVRLRLYAPRDVVVTKSQVSQPAVSTSSREVQVNQVRSWSSPGYTRVVVELSRLGSYSAHLLGARKGQQPRLYVDIKAGAIANQVPASQKVADGLLQGIRVGRHDKDLVRIVLDLETFKDYKVFTLENPQRIVIDVSGKRETVLQAAQPELHAPVVGTGSRDAIAKVLEKTPEEKPLKVPLPASTLLGKLRRIVVDAGHGGKDPGAIGPSGLMEKDVTLAMAKRLATRLEKELGCQVVLTRDKDVFLPLEERTAIANRVGADLFISIHANASTNRNAQGIETYYLNFSKNDKAAAVAARENGTSLKEVGDLELILFDLMANSKINESSRLAAEIQKSLVDQLGRYYPDVKNHGVRQGPFYVLLGANMPSVLVETAFISNKTEEKRLRNSKYQDHAATAIAHAVRNFSLDSKAIANK